MTKVSPVCFFSFIWINTHSHTVHKYENDIHFMPLRWMHTFDQGCSGRRQKENDKIKMKFIAFSPVFPLANYQNCIFFVCFSLFPKSIPYKHTIRIFLCTIWQLLLAPSDFLQSNLIITKNGHGNWSKNRIKHRLYYIECWWNFIINEIDSRRFKWYSKWDILFNLILLADFSSN